MRLKVIVALALVLLMASPAVAQDTTAVAVNTKDGFSVFKLAFQIRRTTQDVVDAGNAAVAFASCSDCQTVAISFQVALLLSDPTVVNPENLALAFNVLCTSCETLASAYQWVLTTEGPVRFTEEGNRQLAELRLRLHELRNSELSIEQVQAEVDAIATDLARILSTELVPAGEVPDTGGTTEGSESPATSPSPTPDDPAPSPSSSVSPSAEPSPTPSP